MNCTTGGGLSAASKGAIKVNHKGHIEKQTGSAFDTTAGSGTVRAGGHKMNSKPLSDPNGFTDNQKVTYKKSTKEYLRRGTGTGGKADSEAKADMDKVLTKRNMLDNKMKKKPAPQSLMERPNPPNTDLRRFYERGDLPVQLDHRGVTNALMWKVDIDQLDYHHYLPIFMTGLREIEQPYGFIALQGCKDMINQSGGDSTNKVLPVIPQLIIPIKEALNTRNKLIVLRVLEILRLLCTCGDNSLIGQALVPYYRQIMPVLNIMMSNHGNWSGDGIDYGQQNGENIKEKILATLELMESKGGDDAFINIKYLIPTFQTTN